MLEETDLILVDDGKFTQSVLPTHGRHFINEADNSPDLRLWDAMWGKSPDYHVYRLNRFKAILLSGSID